MSTSRSDLMKRYHQHLANATPRGSLVTALTEAGIDVHAAHLWAHSDLGSMPAVDLIEIASRWSVVGMAIEEAIEWAEPLYFEPAEATVWHLRGFGPEEADMVREVLPFNTGVTDLAERDAMVRQWLGSGLSVRLVLLGVGSDSPLPWMLSEVTLGRMGEKQEGTLALLAGLRGVDVAARRINFELLARSRSLSGPAVLGQ